MQAPFDISFLIQRQNQTPTVGPSSVWPDRGTSASLRFRSPRRYGPRLEFSVIHMLQKGVISIGRGGGLSTGDMSPGPRRYPLPDPNKKLV